MIRGVVGCATTEDSEAEVKGSGAVTDDGINVPTAAGLKVPLSDATGEPGMKPGASLVSPVVCLDTITGVAESCGIIPIGCLVSPVVCRVVICGVVGGCGQIAVGGVPVSGARMLAGLGVGM
jgi:hypothetical protein